jgi:hypothetical protein
MTKIRKVSVVLVSALAAAGVGAVTVQGCGGSSSSDYVALCNQACDKTATCFGADAAACKQDCTSRGGTVAACGNAAAIKSAYQACVNGTCEAFLTCAATVPACQGSSGQGGSSGGGIGGSTGNSGCTVCDKAATCCVAVAGASGQPTTSCAAFSAATCNAQTGTTQTQLIMSCNQILTAGAGAGIAACR